MSSKQQMQCVQMLASWQGDDAQASSLCSAASDSPKLHSSQQAMHCMQMFSSGHGDDAQASSLLCSAASDSPAVGQQSTANALFADVGITARR
jgi:hypothetical protein